MAYTQFQIVTGSTLSNFTDSVSTASAGGWLVVGAVAATSGSGYMVLMTRGTGAPVPLTELTHSLDSAYPPSPTSSGMWQQTYPPQTANDTLLGINTDPNKNWPFLGQQNDIIS
jgi:hypothetical protein